MGIILGFSLSLIPTAPERRQRELYPQATFNLERDSYALSYDGRTKGAIWVYELLTPDSVAGKAMRKGLQFKEDQDLPEIARSTIRDYLGCGYDRGHLCPAMDSKINEKALSETFLLSNISPQAPNLNRGVWKTLEASIRELASRGNTVHVYTLPLYLPSTENGKRFVRYQVIGESNVAVPTHFAKVAIIEGELTPLAYLIPNHSIPKTVSLESFRTTIERIEKVSGIVLPRTNLRTGF